MLRKTQLIRSTILLRLLVPAILLGIVIAGYLLRLEPARQAGIVEFDREAALHFRMARARVESGRVPEVDWLGLPPGGYPTARLLPALSFEAIAVWHRLLRTLGLGGWDLRYSAVSCTALLGSLIALPLYAAGRGVGLSPGFACIGATFAVLSPVHIARTAGHEVGPAALGLFLVTAHVAALVLALASRRGRGAALGGAVAAFALAAALAAWKEAQSFVALDALIVLGAFAMRALRPPFLIAFAPSLALALTTSLVVPHLMTGPFLLSRTGALAFLTLGLLLLDAATALHARRGWRAGMARAVLVAAILAVSVGLGRASTSERSAHVTAAGLGPLPLIALLYVAGRLLPRERPLLAPPRGPAERAGLVLWHGVAAAVVGITMVGDRDLSVVAPFLALYPALLADAGLFAWRSASFPTAAPRTVALTLAASFFWTTQDAVQVARTTSARLDPDLRSALTWLRAHSRPGDVVLADWDRGHAIQLVTALPTVADARTELPEMRRRIEELIRALTSEDDEKILSLCNRYGARYLWVSAGRERAYAQIAGTPPQPDQGSRTNLGRLLKRPHEFDGLVPRILRGRERIYEAEGDPSARDSVLSNALK